MSDGRVALVCAGVGFVNRGFERFTRDLFAELEQEVDITLFKGGGSSESREVRLRVPRRTDPHAAVLGRQRALELELFLFAARLYPRLRREYDVVHYTEPYLGNVLAAFRHRLGGGYSLLLTDALGLTRRSSSRADVVHVPTPAARDRLLEEGRAADEVVTIPIGIHVERFAGGSKAEAREALGLAPEAWVLLEVAAVNSAHKRIDVLVEEVARLPGDPILLLSGALEEPALLESARERLGERFVFADVSSAETPLLYAAADVFVHAALEEGYGLAIVEAMAASLPVVVHRSPHFEWLVGDPRQLADLALPGAIGGLLEHLPADAGPRNAGRAAELGWERLRSEYVTLYATVRERAAARRG